MVLGLNETAGGSTLAGHVKVNKVSLLDANVCSVVQVERRRMSVIMQAERTGHRACIDRSHGGAVSCWSAGALRAVPHLES